MTLALEWKKMRRTGFFPAFLAGGLLTAAVPVVNMAVHAAVVSSHHRCMYHVSHRICG